MSLAAEAIITGQDSQTLASLGEFGLINALSAWLPPGRRTLVGIGDDAAVLATPDGRVVATTDFLLEGRHFRRDWSGAADVGHKAAARSLADLAAMGAEPSALLVALAAPADLPVSWARELAARAGGRVRPGSGRGQRDRRGHRPRRFGHPGRDRPGRPGRPRPGAPVGRGARRPGGGGGPARAQPRPAWPCCTAGLSHDDLVATTTWWPRTCGPRRRTTPARRPPTWARRP